MKKKLEDLNEIVYSIIVAYKSDEAVYLDRALYSVIYIIENIIKELDT